ncbi:MAG: MarR family transcriptional regulator [Deltaproteobacteria bacterium]|nr:MarR family transcriptional regulator [Deltaproteobacteria bacterium]
MLIILIMFNLDDSLGFLLNRAAFAMRRAFEKRLAKHGLTAPQWAILARLWEEDGQSPSVVGRSLHFDRPTITGIVDRLEQKGLIRKARDSRDRRVIRTYLTDKGMALKKQLQPLAQGVNRIASMGISDADVARMKDCLRNIWRNLKA